MCLNVIITCASAATIIFDILFDNGEYTRTADEITSKRLLGFTDLKPYQKRLDEIQFQNWSER